MRETGIEAYYALKNGKKLRMGYTTGTCAAAAAKAAAILLATGQAPETVSLQTPRGILLSLEVLNPRLEKDFASCAVRKFSGDDPDVTNGILIYAKVRFREAPGISVDGGVGIGRITKPGLKQPVGAAAINPVPTEMIRRAAGEVLEEFGESAGLEIVISAPEGEELAKKTFNPRLGIEGGISILGTSGIVEPMSEAAVLESIELEIRQKFALGCRRLILTPGNYGADFLRSNRHLSETEPVKCSNFIGPSLDLASNAGFTEVLLVGHIGKLVKLSGGIMNTHSREADCRAELIAAAALRAGCSGDTARSILDCVTTDEMLRVLRDDHFLEPAMEALRERIDFYINNRFGGRLTVGVIVFSDSHGILCATESAEKWLKERED